MINKRISEIRKNFNKLFSIELERRKARKDNQTKPDKENTIPLLQFCKVEYYESANDDYDNKSKKLHSSSSISTGKIQKTINIGVIPFYIQMRKTIKYMILDSLPILGIE
jgi:hypothetical protein